MSFLRSILSRGDDKVKNLEQELDEAKARILSLEQEIEQVEQTISSLSFCITAIGAATREIAQDMSMITTAVKTFSKSDSTGVLDWRAKSDDDDFIN
jgi:predicted  nucleic acid-binding Zn-ribbon protein